MKLVLTISDPGNAKARSISRTLETGSLTIGRGESADWTIADPDRVLSKLHCRIEARAGRFILTDTSTNGVFVNGAALPLGDGKTATLNDGDALQLGGLILAVAIDMDAPVQGAGAIPPEAFSFIDMLGRAYAKEGAAGGEPGTGPQTIAEPDWIAPAARDTVPVQHQAFTPPAVRTAGKEATVGSIPDDWLAPSASAFPAPAPINGERMPERMPERAAVRAIEPSAEPIPAAEITERHHRALITGLASLAAGDASLRAALGCAVDPAGPDSVLALADSKALRGALGSGDSTAVTKVLAAGLAHQSALAAAIRTAVDGLAGPAAFDFKTTLAATYRRVFEARTRPSPTRKE